MTEYWITLNKSYMHRQLDGSLIWPLYNEYLLCQRQIKTNKKIMITSIHQNLIKNDANVSTQKIDKFPIFCNILLFYDFKYDCTLYTETF